jgi:predicted acylesterase/phospholipase RssA
MTLGAADSVAAARRHADVVITPDVSGIGMLDWRRLDEMREAGARAARHTLESQPGLLTS